MWEKSILVDGLVGSSVTGLCGQSVKQTDRRTKMCFYENRYSVLQTDNQGLSWADGAGRVDLKIVMRRAGPARVESLENLIAQVRPGRQLSKSDGPGRAGRGRE